MRLPYPLKRRKSNPIKELSKSIPNLPTRRQTCKTLRLLFYSILLVLLFILIKSILFKSSNSNYGGINMDAFLANTNAKIESNSRFFKPKIYIKYSNVAQSKKQFFDFDTAKLISNSLGYKRVVLNGFKYCGMLNNSIFYTDVPLFDLGGSIASVNPTNQQLIRMMDTKAKSIHKTLMDRFDQASPMDSKRLACYSTALGNVGLSNMSEHRFISEIDPTVYFKDQLPHLVPVNTIQKRKRKYKLAYYLFVKSAGGTPQLQHLLDLLDDGEAIILIQVDVSDSLLYKTVERITEEKKSKNVYMGKNYLSFVHGHVNDVFGFLNGAFELIDLAEWDYIINLSSFDYPLRKNNEVYRILEKRDGNNWIDFWMDTQQLSFRMFRPHLGSSQSDISQHFHEFGVSSWPFPNMRIFKQSPWMILTRDAMKHFRSNQKSLDFLAFMEFSYLPSESFYASVLFNTPEFENKIQREKRRYDREPGSGAVWIGWADRHIFPPGEKEPRYLFFRPFNSKGNIYEESKLLRWVERNHLEMQKGNECLVSQIGQREECLRAFAEKVAIDNHIILVPVNKAFLTLALNLRCSLINLGMTNIIFLALDSEAHDELVEAGFLSIHMPHSFGSPALLKPDSQDFKRILRQKPGILKKLISAGFHIWCLDADTVVLGDFVDRVHKYTLDPYKADVMISMNEKDHLEIGKKLPSISPGILYLRNTQGSRQFLDNLEGKLESNKDLDFSEAVEKLVHDLNLISISSIGAIKEDIYPDLLRSKEEKVSKPDSRHSGHFSGLYSIYKSDYTPQEEGGTATKTRLHVLDQNEFVNGDIFFKSQGANSVHHHKIIHIGRGKQDPERALRSKGLWFVDNKGSCVSRKKTVFH